MHFLLLLQWLHMYWKILLLNQFITAIFFIFKIISPWKKVTVEIKRLQFYYFFFLKKKRWHTFSFTFEFFFIKLLKLKFTNTLLELCWLFCVCLFLLLCCFFAVHCLFCCLNKKSNKICLEKIKNKFNSECVHYAAIYCSLLCLGP